MKRLRLAGLTPIAVGACASLAGLTGGGGADGGGLDSDFDAGHDCGSCKTPHDASSANRDVTSAEATTEAGRRDSTVPDSAASDGTSPNDAKVATDTAPDASTHDATGFDATQADAHVASDGGADAPQVPITWRATTTATVPQTGAASITVNVPATTLSGDVLIATVAMGNTTSPTLPTFTAPGGWTLINRIDDADSTSLAVYWHVAGAAEPASYTWSFSPNIEGESWISDYSGVDTVTPVEAKNGVVDVVVASSYQTPPIATITAHSVVLAVFASHASAPSTWTAPSLTTVRASLNNGSTRAALGVELVVAAPESVGPLTATVDNPQDYALVEVLALRPAP